LLPGLVQALGAQTYPVHRVVGVDTGSRDRSGAVLAELIGQDAVFGMDRDTGFGAAVAMALGQGTSRRLSPERHQREWVWLLHDDCEPAPGALERLLSAASRDGSAAVLGPKVLDWADRRVLREAGISVDRAGRRVTGIEPGEIDQGQHDGNRGVLAVSSVGMLVRREVWERVGGFDPWLPLFRDDLDFCWRVHGAGQRVQVITSAVVYHRELAARQVRAIEGGRPRRLDRRNALYVLAVNLPVIAMARILAGCIAGSLLRAAYFLLTKQPDRAWDHLGALGGVLGHPGRLWRARRRRAAGRRQAYNAVRMYIRPGRTVARLAEQVAGLLSSGPPRASGGLHQASEEPEDEQFIESQSLVRRVLANRCVQLCAALVVIALVAERRLLGSGPLGGGALVPAWGGASGLWREYLAGYHSAGAGSAASAPPYLAVVAACATLLGCVPGAGLTAYLATRRITTVTAARVWMAASYALLPVAMGAIAAGRLGTAVAFMLIPLIGMAAGRMLTGAPRAARRAAWAVALLVAVAAAFVPLLWPLAAVFAAGAAARRRGGPLPVVNAAIVAVVPGVLLLPWTVHLLSSPSAFLLEAGVQRAGLATTDLRAGSLLLLSPGGPGLPPVWVTAGLGLALAATLLPHRRAPLVLTGWCVALGGLAAAVAVSRASVTPVQGGAPVSAWPGAALAVTAAGLLAAAAPAAEWLARMAGVRPAGPASARGAGGQEAREGIAEAAEADGGPAAARGFRRAAAVTALAAAATAPVLAAVYWVGGGVRGPVAPVASPVLPAFVSASSGAPGWARTLVLRRDDGEVTYFVARQGDPALGDPELTEPAATRDALSRTVASLAATDSADAGDPGQLLSGFAIKWVLLPGPVDPGLAQQLDGAAGLVSLSKSAAYDLWEVAGPVARARVVSPDGTVVTLPSGQVTLAGDSAPRAGGTLLLAEPAGGWTATLNGRPLTPLSQPADGWAQGFVLPPGGGQLAIGRDEIPRDLSLGAELAALLAVCALALPGKRAEATAGAQPAPAGARRGRRASKAADRGRRDGATPRRNRAADRRDGAPERRPARAPAVAGRRRHGAPLPGDDTAVARDAAVTGDIAGAGASGPAEPPWPGGSGPRPAFDPFGPTRRGGSGPQPTSDPGRPADFSWPGSAWSGDDAWSSDLPPQPPQSRQPAQPPQSVQPPQSAEFSWRGHGPYTDAGWPDEAGQRGDPGWPDEAGQRADPGWPDEAGQRADPGWPGDSGAYDAGGPGESGPRADPGWPGDSGIQADPAWPGDSGLQSGSGWAFGRQDRSGDPAEPGPPDDDSWPARAAEPVAAAPPATSDAAGTGGGRGSHRAARHGRRPGGRRRGSAAQDTDGGRR